MGRPEGEVFVGSGIAEFEARLQDSTIPTPSYLHEAFRCALRDSPPG